MNKPVYLELLILELSKILMYEFWYDYIKNIGYAKKNGLKIHFPITKVKTIFCQKTFYTL